VSTIGPAIPLASARTEIASFLDALITVYVVLIILHILISLVQTAGMRIPYNAVTGALFRFLDEVVEPYLAFFRRFIPPLGPFDFSPIVGILVLTIGGRLVVSLVQG
jgi:uncharacterized protein YggT (Ycf19 family)